MGICAGIPADNLTVCYGKSPWLKGNPAPPIVEAQARACVQ